MANTVEFVIRARDAASATLKEVSSAIEKIGEDAATSSKNAVENFNKLTTAAGQGFDALTGNYSELGNVIGALPGPIAAVAGTVVGAIGEMVEATIKQADAYDKLAQKTGASVEFLSEFTEAADDVRVSSETVARGLEVFSRKLGGVETAEDGAVEGSKKLVDALKEVGVVLPTAEDGAVDLEAAMMAVADQFAAMPDGAQKTALAVQLFGKAGAELIPILNKGSEEIKAMGDEAKALGLTFSRDTVDAAKMLLAQQDALGDQWSGMQRQLGQSLIPALLNFTTALNANGQEASKVKVSYSGLGALIDYQVRAFSVLKDAVTGESAAKAANTAAAKEAEQAALKTSEALKAETGIIYNVAAALEVHRARGMDSVHAEESLAASVANTRDASDRLSSATINLASQTALTDQQTELARQGQERYQQALAASETAERNLIAALNASFEPMTQKERLTWALEIATGKKTLADLAADTAHRALMKALQEGFITEDQYIKNIIAMENGTLSAKDAMERAGPAAAAIRNSYAEVASAAQSGKDKVDKLSDAITRVPKETNVAVLTDANTAAVDAYLQRIAAIPSNVTTTITTVHRDVYTADPAPGDDGGNGTLGVKTLSRGTGTVGPRISIGGTTINVNGANAAALARQISANNAAEARAAARLAAYGGI